MITRDKSELESNGLQVARRLHPEDLKVGDDIVITEVSHQYGTFAWCGLNSFEFPADEVVTLTYLAIDSHFPQKVVSICLPFLLCEQVDSKHVIHDVRSVQLARLESGFAEAARSAYKADRELESTEKPKKKKKKKRKGKKKQR